MQYLSDICSWLTIDESIVSGMDWCQFDKTQIQAPASVQSLRCAMSYFIFKNCNQYAKRTYRLDKLYAAAVYLLYMRV